MTKETKKPHDPRKAIAWLVIAVAGLVYWVATNPQKAGYTLMMLLGFGAVIFVHELGHFLAAKAVGIQVDTFSLGFGWVVLGIKRVAGGIRMRILPDLLPSEDGNGILCVTIPSARATQGETEYRLSLIPLGGFVAMLGQEDMAEAKASDNPRSFPNKPAWQRAIVFSAGVFMNLVIGSIVFMLVFSQGINQTPPVIGDVIEGKPAYNAGLRAGDEVIAIGDKRAYLNFTDLRIASALTGNNETVVLTVRHPDGSEAVYEVEPEMNNDLGMPIMGLTGAATLTIAHPYDDKYKEQALEELAKLGLEPGDTVVAINGEAIEHGYQLQTAMFPKSTVISAKVLALTISRQGEDGGITEHELETEMVLRAGGPGSTAGAVLGMTPQVRIGDVAEDQPAAKAGVLKDDIILSFGSIESPTTTEVQELCWNNDGKTLELKVLRIEDGRAVEKVLEITPRAPQRTTWQKLLGASNNGKIGVSLTLALTAPTVANCTTYLDKQGPLPLPRGATITSVAGAAVANWEQIINELRDRSGEEVAINYRIDDTADEQSITVTVPTQTGWIGFAYRPKLWEFYSLPWKPLERMYKAKDWSESLRMGTLTSGRWITQTYLNIRGMLTLRISPKLMAGPVGLLNLTYRMAKEKSFIEFCHFMAMINVLIAVFNFLPLPVLDGGHVVFLLVEKVKGSPVPPKIQMNITYVGMALLLGFVLYVTFHDITRVWG